MSTKQAKRWLGVTAVWLVIFGALAVLGKPYVPPWPWWGNGPPSIWPEWDDPWKGARIQRVEAQTIRFEDNGELNEYCRTNLVPKVVKVLNDNPGSRAMIVAYGYFDEKAIGQENRKTREAALGRAQKVKAELQGKGVDEARIVRAEYPEKLKKGEVRVEEVFRATIRFSPGTARMMPFCESTIETLADKLNANPQYRVRTIGHISGGSTSTPEEERQLALDQVKEVRRRLRDKGVSETRMLTETSTDPDENGAYGVVTCIVERKKSDSDVDCVVQIRKQD